MATITQHLKDIYYVVLNNAKYGIEPREDQDLQRFLASTDEKFDFTSKLGAFSLMRTTQKNSDGDRYGFRLYSQSRDFGTPEAAEALVAANAEFVTLDTTNPEATWHVKPFWA
jgi:hypothetical protein